MATLTKFKTLNEAELAAVEGGADKITAGEVVQAAGACTVFGAALGTFFAPGIGTGAGAILGGQYCTAFWLAVRGH